MLEEAKETAAARIRAGITGRDARRDVGALMRISDAASVLQGGLNGSVARSVVDCMTMAAAFDAEFEGADGGTDGTFNVGDSNISENDGTVGTDTETGTIGTRSHQGVNLSDRQHVDRQHVDRQHADRQLSIEPAWYVGLEGAGLQETLMAMSPADRQHALGSGCSFEMKVASSMPSKHRLEVLRAMPTATQVEVLEALGPLLQQETALRLSPTELLLLVQGA